MIRDFYSNTDFEDLKKRLNQEIQRRGTFKWWDPLTKPRVGEDRSSPLSLPAKGHRIEVDERTYAINDPSDGSIEPTRNINFPAHSENPGGTHGMPTTSAAELNLDEIKNFIVGLAKINDINLFYGRDEIAYLAYRDPQGILDTLTMAEESVRNKPLKNSDISPTKIDPNGGAIDHRIDGYPQPTQVTYPMENGQYVMPSGELDGEELSEVDGVGVYNFFDDYGAKPGDSHYHPFNRAYTPQVRRDWDDQGEMRTDLPTKIVEGGIPTSSYGANPRNPNSGQPYVSRAVYGGIAGGCHVACTGLCYTTCDSECSESCSTTCWNRCGNACTASCGNVCTGCSTMCYTSCKTKCENSTGYACHKAGAMTMKVATKGGHDGEPPKNELVIQYYSCNGCSYSCQFYPNKKTECWDAACMGRCFITCNIACSTSCFGGCIDNDPKRSESYKTGIGKGCSSGCTINCVGICEGTCQGYCIQTCWKACKQQCTDNCSWTCMTHCGTGCADKCKNLCIGCTGTCTESCTGKAYNKNCTGCSAEGGCTSTCQHDCNRNCMGWGCRSICGTDSAGACESNCRLNCMNTSCTAMCSDACSDTCNTCVNTCGFQCGTCSSMCSVGCGAECNITCSQRCEHSCDYNCVHSCTEDCGGCSNLCYSCVGMCIGVCSVKCEDGCSSCTNTCGWWCDTSCSRDCFMNCDTFCINDCTGSCISYLSSETKLTSGPERQPTSDGYIYKYPRNRWEERESFKITGPVGHKEKEPDKDYLITIDFDNDRNLRVTAPPELQYDIKQSSINGGVYSIDHETGKTIINFDMLGSIVGSNIINLDNGSGVYVVTLMYNMALFYDDSDILVKVPFGFGVLDYIHDRSGNIYIIIERDPFLMHGDGGDEYNEPGE